MAKEFYIGNVFIYMVQPYTSPIPYQVKYRNSVQATCLNSKAIYVNLFFPS